MSNKKLALILGIVALILFSIGTVLILTNIDNEAGRVTDTRTESPQLSEPSQQSSAEQNDTAKAETIFTSAQVSENNSMNSCWTVIDGKVYDITEYIPRHPGGDDILKACGQDGSSLFNSRKTTEGEVVGSGEPHSRSARNQLEKLYIGDLAQ